MKSAVKPPQAYYTYDFKHHKFQFRWPDNLQSKMPNELIAYLPHTPHGIDPEAAQQFRQAQDELEKVLSRARQLLQGPCEFILVDELLDPSPQTQQTQTDLFTNS